jgi:aldose 1-epimerase
VLDQAPKGAGSMWLSAILRDPKSGRMMEVWSNQPGIQFYTGNFLDGIPGKDGAVYQKNGALCLETQAFPDSINKQGKAGWPNVVLRPGQTYEHNMVHRFVTAPGNS